MRQLIRVGILLLGCFACVVGEAGDMKHASPVWGYSCYAGSCFGRSLASCEAAKAQLIAAETARVESEGRSIIAGSFTGVCPTDPNVASLAVTYQEPGPVTRDGLGVKMYCDGGDFTQDPPLSQDPSVGRHCERSSTPPVKAPDNMGDCPDCTVGNPIAPGFGNKIERETDYVGGGPYPLKFERIYNSARTDITTAPGLGTNWWHTYHRKLVFSGPTPAAPNFVSAQRPDGRTFNFNRDGTGAYPADANVAERLEYVTADSTWRLVNRDDEVEVYDAEGKLKSITNRTGLSHTLEYFLTGDKLGLLRKAYDSFQRFLEFDYVGGQMSVMIDPAGGRYEYTVELVLSRHLLTKVKYPNDRTRSYAYESGSSRLAGIKEDGVNGFQFATFTYTSGKPTTTLRGGELQAGKVDLSYNPVPDDPNQYTDVTMYVDDQALLLPPQPPAQRRYKYQVVMGVSRLAAIEQTPGQPFLPCPSCGPKAQTFDPANGNVLTRTDWNNFQTCFAYKDPAGDTPLHRKNLESKRIEGFEGTAAACTSLVNQAVPPLVNGETPRLISTTWHPDFRLPLTIAEPKRRTTFTYDQPGAPCVFNGATPPTAVSLPGMLCSKSVQETDDPTGKTGLGATLIGVARTWSYTYNANGQVTKVTGPSGEETKYTYSGGNVSLVEVKVEGTSYLSTSFPSYNPHGQPLEMLDANGLTTTFEYDSLRRLVKRCSGGQVATCTGGTAGELTSYSYDDDRSRQLEKITLPDNSSIEYVYDDAHRLKEIFDNAGNKTVYSLDLAGNRKGEQVFDTTGGTETPRQSRSRAYSNLNRLTRETNGSSSSQYLDYEYWDGGQVKKVTTPPVGPVGGPLVALETEHFYDALNRLIRTKDPLGGETHYKYNGLDALTKVTDPRGFITDYNLDGLGNLSDETSPPFESTIPDSKAKCPPSPEPCYDASGNRLAWVNPENQKTTYSYDLLSRVKEVIFHDLSKQVYEYDNPAPGSNGKGRLWKITEKNNSNEVVHAIEYAYNMHGRVTSETRTIGSLIQVIAYSYDSAGRLNAITYPSGRTVTYEFDAVGRVNKVTTTKNSQTRVVVQNVQYHPFGVAKSWTYGNSQAYNRNIDLDGRVASYLNGSVQYDIGYDNAGRITSIQAPSLTSTNTYDYDKLDRLTSAVLTSPTSNYGYTYYDGVGNRWKKTTGIAEETLEYVTGTSRIHKLTPASGPERIFGYDKNGSTTSDGLSTYTYDKRGRMERAISSAGTFDYLVNALGQRVKKTKVSPTPSTVTVFTYDMAGKLIAESDGAGTAIRELIYLGDIPVGVLQ